MEEEYDVDAGAGMDILEAVDVGGDSADDVRLVVGFGHGEGGSPPEYSGMNRGCCVGGASCVFVYGRERIVSTGIDIERSDGENDYHPPRLFYIKEREIATICTQEDVPVSQQNVYSFVSRLGFLIHDSILQLEDVATPTAESGFLLLLRLLRHTPRYLLIVIS